jgi:hypothetical protein
MVSGLFSTARELPRLREISSVFVRHGLGDLVRRAGIATLLEFTPGTYCSGKKPVKSRLSNRSSARGSRSSSSGRPS